MDKQEKGYILLLSHPKFSGVYKITGSSTKDGDYSPFVLDSSYSASYYKSQLRWLQRVLAQYRLSVEEEYFKVDKMTILFNIKEITIDCIWSDVSEQSETLEKMLIKINEYKHSSILEEIHKELTDIN